MIFINIQFQIQMTTLTLWHGGRDLEFNYKNNQSSKKGKWEHGPGLYLTTHYDTAYQYAKGGGKTYQVTVELGNNIYDVMLDISIVNDFVLKNIIKSKRKSVLQSLYDNMQRLNHTTTIRAEYVLNIIFNNNAISHTKTNLLAEFLINNGVDYGIATRFKGRDETVLIVYNKQKIQSIVTRPAKTVSLDEWELPFNLVPNIIKPHSKFF